MDIQNYSKEQIKQLIIDRLSFKHLESHLRHVDKETFIAKEHIRFDMSGYETVSGESVKDTQDILSKFADLGIYDYTTYLFLDFYKGQSTLYYQLWTKPDNLTVDYSGWGTIEIIEDLLMRTVFSGNEKRRRN